MKNYGELSPSEAQALIDSESACVIDIRARISITHALSESISACASEGDSSP